MTFIPGRPVWIFAVIRRLMAQGTIAAIVMRLVPLFYSVLLMVGAGMFAMRFSGRIIRHQL
ncbi:MAG TPA: hypothetical protein VFA55_03865 [Candidatus Kapabacteria bacterium]|nr:hypothetical protein [Candidatus Kapabacteria bacterium]